MTSSPSVVRKGSQLPRIESYPLFNTSAADDAVDLAAMAGLVLDPWQEHVLRGSLGERVDGRWSAFRTCLVVPRQNGKNAVLEARELAGLLLFGEQTIVHTAHEFKTAFKSMVALMNRLRVSPLMEYVKGFDGEASDIRDIDGFKTGNNPGITLKNGNQLLYAARSKGSGRGFTGDLVVLDEAYALKIEEMAALLPTMAAKSIEGNPQVWFTSSAGMNESNLLASLRQQGMDKSSDRLAYYEWSAPDDAEPDDVEAWYVANPGLGYRISEEFIRDEMETMVVKTGSDEEFKRERLGIWAKLGADPIFPAGLWASRLAEDAGVLSGPVVAVDMRTGLQQSVAIGVAGHTEHGFDLVDIARYELGADAQWSENFVVDETLAILARHDLDTVALDGYAENEPLVVRFEAAGVKVIKLGTRDMANAAVAFTDALLNDRIRHTGNVHLGRAVAAAAKRTYGDSAFLWSQPKSLGDITTLRAVTVAWAVLASGVTADYDVLESVG